MNTRMRAWIERRQALWTNIGLAVLRVSVSALMLARGAPRLANISEQAAETANPIGVGSELSWAFAVFAEFVCPLFVMAGLWTRLASLPLLLMMSVVFFVVHAGDSFLEREPSLLYFFAYAAVLFLGPGKYSIDELLKNRGETLISR